MVAPPFLPLPWMGSATAPRTDRERTYHTTRFVWYAWPSELTPDRVDTVPPPVTCEVTPHHEQGHRDARGHRQPPGIIEVALVGFQGRGGVEVVQRHCCHPFLL